jgi:arylsulfatase A-like enzyme
MPANVLIVVIDGLRASAFGAYGNTSFATAALDSFAAGSLLLDWCFAPSAELVEIYRALWCSHASDSLPRLFAERQYSTTLITDESSLQTFPAANDFESILNVSTASETTDSCHRPTDPLETALARTLSTAWDQISHHRGAKPRLVWVHARGMYGPWDSPLAFQELLLDEEYPAPIEAMTPPNLVMEDEDDPDIVFRHTTAYAAQTMVLDACWETFLDAQSLAPESWLVMVLGARGFPLGEHRRIGGIDPRMYTEQLHVPWLVHFPDNLGRLARSGALTSHCDLLPTLVDWLDGSHQSTSSTVDGISLLPLASTTKTMWRSAVLSTSASARAIRTCAWCLREDLSENDSVNASGKLASAAELFVRPDDRWEANDVAKLCPDVVEELRGILATISSRPS